MSGSLERTDSARLVYITTVPKTLSFLAGHARYAAAGGLEVHAISSPDPELRDFAKDTGAIVHPVEMSRRITPVRDLIALTNMTKLLKKIRPSIVHAHTPKGGLIGMMAARAAGVPIRIYHNHGLPHLTASGSRRALLMASERFSSHCADEVFCVSSSMATIGIRERLFQKDKVSVLLKGSISGIDARSLFNPCLIGEEDRREIRRELGIPQESIVIGYAGRIVRDKGMIEMVEAWQALRKTFSSICMLVAGEFESQDPVPQEVERVLREDPGIVLAGHRDDMPRVYSAMDVFVLPTYREGFGLAALEASAMEIPVVATRIPGCVDSVVDGETGTLVPARDSSALTEAVRSYLVHSDLRKQHGVAGRDRVIRDFGQEQMLEAMYREYVRLLAARGIHPVQVSHSRGRS